MKVDNIIWFLCRSSFSVILISRVLVYLLTSGVKLLQPWWQRRSFLQTVSTTTSHLKTSHSPAPASVWPHPVLIPISVLTGWFQWWQVRRVTVIVMDKFCLMWMWNCTKHSVKWMMSEAVVLVKPYRQMKIVGWGWWSVPDEIKYKQALGLLFRLEEGVAALITPQVVTISEEIYLQNFSQLKRKISDCTSFIICLE